jgi:asparagine synthase (glutamine-hydrolysing)
LLRATRELGLPSMLLYLQHQVALRTGRLRRQTPIFDWDEKPLRQWLRSSILAEPEAYAAFRRTGSRFLFEPAGDLAPALRDVLGDAAPALIEEADGILEGRFPLFGAPAIHLGFPPEWHAFAPIAGAETAARMPADAHWSTVRELKSPADIKLLWEPSRFAWAFTLGRAYRLTNEQRYAEGFWSLFESWRAAIRPNAGPHWLSGQEVALRIFALAFALHAFAAWLADDPERVPLLVSTIAVHAARIPPTLGYSRSLSNNHLISEAAGLFTAGLLFPELRGAARWKALGRGLLRSALLRQFYPDGGHVQHSLNYHRLVLQAGLWCARLADLNAEPLPNAALAALRRGTDLLAAMADPATGAAPNLGANDGAQILPLTTCTFEDYRPTLQLAAATLATPPQTPGPWWEASFWFGSVAPAGAPSTHVPRRDFPQAGLYRLAGARSWAVLRAARFTSRPSHSDQLHLDLWRRGHNILCDAGSYLYVAPPPWDNGLALAAAHNAVRVDGDEPMRRAGPFLWLEWAHARFLGRWASDVLPLEALAAEHTGYRKIGVVHRRTVARLGDDAWLIADDVLGSGRHTATLAWLLPDSPDPRLEIGGLSLHWPGVSLLIEVETPQQEASPRSALYREGGRIAGEAIRHAAGTWGWHSHTYAHRRPALTLVSEVEGPLPLRVVTWFRFDGATREGLRIEWTAPGEGRSALRSLALGNEKLQIPG